MSRMGHQKCGDANSAACQGWQGSTTTSGSSYGLFGHDEWQEYVVRGFLEVGMEETLCK